MSNSEELFLIKHQADVLLNSPSYTFNKNESTEDLFWGSNENWTKDPKKLFALLKAKELQWLENCYLSMVIFQF